MLYYWSWNTDEQTHPIIQLYVIIYPCPHLSADNIFVAWKLSWISSMLNVYWEVIPVHASHS